MALATLAFVTGPASSPTTVESLTSTPSWLGAVDDFVLGAPTFEAGPDSIGGEYGWRTCSFTLRLIGSYSTVATKMQTIARQLLASRNWLMVKWQTTPQPMFLRTYRTAQEAVNWQQSRGDVWELPVTLVCDPWLTGVREDIGLHAFSNDLAGATPVWSVGSIKGDFRTPLVAWSAVPVATSRFLLTSSLVPPLLIEAESGTNGTNTTSVSADATLSGSAGKLFTPASSGTTAARVVGLAIPSGTPAGDYKILARVRKSVAGDVFALGTDGTTQQPVQIASATTCQVIELDGYRISLDDAAPGYEAALLSGAETFDLSIQRVSGTGTLTIDWVALVPVDEPDDTFARVEVGATAGAALVLDAATEDSFWTAATAGPFAAGARNTNILGTLVRGGLPYVSPAGSNYLGMWWQSASDSLTTRSFTLSYWPRYLHMRPDTT